MVIYIILIFLLYFLFLTKKLSSNDYKGLDNHRLYMIFLPPNFWDFSDAFQFICY